MPAPRVCLGPFKPLCSVNDDNWLYVFKAPATSLVSSVWYALSPVLSRWVLLMIGRAPPAAGLEFVWPLLIGVPTCESFTFGLAKRLFFLP